MPSSIPAAAIIAALSLLPALAQSQPSTPCTPQTGAQKAASRFKSVTDKINQAQGKATTPAPAPCPAISAAPASGGAVASGPANPDFLKSDTGNMGPLAWTHPRANTGYTRPNIFYNSGVAINGNGGLVGLSFDGDENTVQDGRGNYYLRDSMDHHYRISISGGRFEMAEISPGQIPRDLMNLDGSRPEVAAAAPATVTGSLRVLPMAAEQVRDMEQGAHAPDWQLAEKLGRLTLPQGAAMVVHQDKGDAPNFWRRDDDPFVAFLVDEGAVTMLSRTKSDPADAWKIVDSQGQVKGVYSAVRK